MELRWKKLDNKKEAHRLQCFIHDDKEETPEENPKPTSLRKRMKRKIEEYINGFTVHGLTRVLTTTKLESFFWFFILVCGILLASYIIHGRMSKYYKFDIFTEIGSKITKKNSFPAISFCEANFLVSTFFAYCGKTMNLKHENNHLPCSLIDRGFKEISSSVHKNTWSNGMFNFTNCNTWGGKQCTNQMYLLSSKGYNHSCVTWNYQGNFNDNIYGHVEMTFHFRHPTRANYTPIIYAIPHDSAVKEIDLTKKVHLDPKKVYDIKIDKSLIKRLKAPFPSNCTYSKNRDIFPGKYSRRGCVESHNYINMFKACGDTLDYVRNFIPRDILTKYGNKKRSIKEVKDCIYKYSKKEADNSYDCPFPCESVDLSVLPVSHEEIRGSSAYTTYYVNIQLEHVDTIRTIEEKELYSWYQMTCEIGGFVGLVIGASLISCIEIIACLVLLIIQKCL